MVIRRPALLLVVALSVLTAMVAGAAMLASSFPQLGVAVRSDPTGPVRVEAVDGVASRSTLVGIVGDGRLVRLDGAADAVRRTERGLAPAALAAQDKALGATAGGTARLILRDERGRLASLERPVARRHLGWRFWLSAVAGSVGAAVGLWVLVLRPDAAAARAVALSGAGLFAAALSFAVLMNGELIVGGTRWFALVVTNWIGAQLFGAALIACFLVYPVPLGSPASRRAINGLLAATVPAVGVPTAFGLTGFAYVSGWIFADFVMIATMVLWQWRRARRDPVARGSLRLVGGVTVATLTAFLLLAFLPLTMGGEPELAEVIGFAVVLPPYLVIALSAMRGRFLELDRWAGRLLVVSGLLLALVVTDATLVASAGLAANSAASLAMLVVGACWIAARQTVTKRLFGRTRERQEELYARAGAVALAQTPAERFRQWREALTDCFSPLQVHSVQTDTDGASIGEGGLVLLVPAPGFGDALMLRAARGGSALFRARDAAMVDTFARLCTRAGEERAAYDRGTREERIRIARDLHDDVSGRLLTSLHRRDPDQGRADVRAALGDLRTLVSDLQHGAGTMDELCAAVRVDAAERLDAAGVLLVVEERGIGTDAVSGAVARAVASAMREAVTNVARHSAGRHARLVMEVAEQGAGARLLTATLEDDGRGFDPQSDGVGHGLRNIAARMTSVGGKASFGHAGAGGCVSLSVPLG